MFGGFLDQHPRVQHTERSCALHSDCPSYECVQGAGPANRTIRRVGERISKNFLEQHRHLRSPVPAAFDREILAPEILRAHASPPSKPSCVSRTKVTVPQGIMVCILKSNRSRKILLVVSRRHGRRTGGPICLLRAFDRISRYLPHEPPKNAPWSSCPPHRNCNSLLQSASRHDSFARSVHDGQPHRRSKRFCQRVHH